MKIYTVERMDKYDYDFSVELKKCGAFEDRKKAIRKAKEVFDSMCGEYEDEMLRYSDKDEYIDEDEGALHVIKDAVFGYYKISFGAEENYEVHSVAVEEWEVEE